MSFFHRAKRSGAEPFDLSTQQPAMRKSICTGEITVGYIDRATGKFHDMQLAASQQKAEAFFRDRGAGDQEIKVIY